MFSIGKHTGHLPRSKENIIENQPSIFGTLWQSLVAFFKSFGDTNIAAVTVVVVVIVVAALFWSERADRRKLRKMSGKNRLRQRK